MCTVPSSDRRRRFLQYNFMDPGWGGGQNFLWGGRPSPLPAAGAGARRCYAMQFLSCGVCLWRSWMMSKRVIVSSNFFAPSCRQIILVCPYQTSRQFSDGDPRKGASDAGGVPVLTNHDSGRIAGCGSMTAGHASNCDGRSCSLSHRRRSISESLFITACSVDEYAEENRIVSS